MAICQCGYMASTISYTSMQLHGYVASWLLSSVAIYDMFTLVSVITQVLVGPSKQLKQIIQIEDSNVIMNPNWPEANQLAIYKRGREAELWATE